MKIRKATRRDIPRLVELWWELQVQYFSYDLPYYRNKSKAACFRLCQKRLEKYFQDPNVILLVAQQGSAVIGFVIGEVLPRSNYHRVETYGDVGPLGVAAGWRRQRIGTRLMQALEKEFRRRQVRLAQLYVDRRNHPALGFYRRRGFDERMVHLIKWL